jgi:hypothetical protein
MFTKVSIINKNYTQLSPVGNNKKAASPLKVVAKQQLEVTTCHIDGIQVQSALRIQPAHGQHSVVTEDQKDDLKYHA